MADNTIKFNLRIGAFGMEAPVRISESLKELQKNLQDTKTWSQKLGESLVTLNQGTQVFTNIGNAVSNLKASMDTFVGVYNNATQAETKLVTVMRQRMGANDDMVKSVNQVIADQTKLGVVGGTVQKSGAQQVATFLNEASSLKILIPAMNDLLTQQRGINATSEDAVSVANLMGKAMQGQTSALKRVGITFTDAQAEVMKYGTETEKASMLAEIITDNVGHMNAELAKTDAGKVKQTSNEFAGLMKSIGGALSPYQALINQFAMFGMAASSVLQVGSAMVSLTRAIGLTTIVTKLASGAQASFAAMINLVKAASTGAAISMNTLRAGIGGVIASLGLAGAAWLALSAILEVVINKLMGFDSASDAAAEGAQKVAEANAQAKEEVKDATSKLEQNIAMTKNFKGTKDEEKNVVDDLNATYGSTIGYFSSVHEWYNALIKDSKAYCEQLTIEAENRKLADQIAEIYGKKRDLLYDENGKPKLYDTTRKIRPYGTTGKSIVLPSEHDKVEQTILGFNTQIHVLQKAMQDNYNRERNIRMPVRGAKARPTPKVKVSDMNLGQVKTEIDKTESKLKSVTPGSKEAKSLAAYNKQLKERKKTLEQTYHISEKTGKNGKKKTVQLGDELRSNPVSEKDFENNYKYYDKKISQYKGKNKELLASWQKLRDKSKETFEQMKFDRENKGGANIKFDVNAIPKINWKDTGPGLLNGLQQDLDRAQSKESSALTVDAFVKAQAEVANIQKQIDILTNGELTIPAEVEPVRIKKGNEEDKFRSYQNAQAQTNKIQQMFELKIIGADKAKSLIDEINKKLKDLHIEPIKIDLEAPDVTGIKEAFSSMGGEMSQITGQWKSLGKVFDQTSNAGVAAGGSMALVGQELQNMAGDGAAAKVGAIMAAIGQLVLGFAYATSTAGKTLGPFGWIGFAIAGAATLASIIAQVSSFSTGGIVGGSSYHGDKVPARVNSGEMILTMVQQKRLFDIANGMTVPQLPVVSPGTSQLSGMLSQPVIDVSIGGEVQGTALKMVLRNTEKKYGKVGKKWS